jgi:hypothetical protein
MHKGRIETYTAAGLSHYRLREKGLQYDLSDCAIAIWKACFPA